MLNRIRESKINEFIQWATAADIFIGKTIYQNSHYGIELTYPEGSVFAGAHPEAGFITRFFIPNGKEIGGDQENVGVHVLEYSGTAEDRIRDMRNAFEGNGSFDVIDFELGGQRGYKMIFVSDYTAMPSKQTREMIYLAVKDGVLYEINYFPVIDESVALIDTIAKSFKFKFVEPQRVKFEEPIRDLDPESEKVRKTLIDIQNQIND